MIPMQTLMETDCEDDTCVGKFDKCGGTGFNISLPCCDEGVMCIVKNYWYDSGLCITTAATLFDNV